MKTRILRQRPEQFWHEHQERCRQSGMSQRAYCSQHGLALSTFTRYQRLAAAKQKPCFEIVPVGRMPRPVSAMPLALVVKDGRYRLEIGDESQAHTLRAVLDVLEAR